MAGAVTPGISTGELDALAREVFRRHGARSAPIVTYRFPGATCISVNDEAAHGIPSFTRQLREGDLVNLDVSIELDGYFSDTGMSVAVGEVRPIARRLLDATRLAHGFRVIRNLNGHGIGRGLHEAPSVPSVDEGQSLVLREGLVLAIEPFLSPTADEVIEGEDGWTLCTVDGSLVAQFEHSIVVTQNGPIVLTT
jgi:methionyl aminopeptidase